MIGVPIKDPNVPPFEMVKVPPCISSIEIFPSFPFLARLASPWDYHKNYKLKIVELQVLTVSYDWNK
jgi:hypothetical protein